MRADQLNASEVHGLYLTYKGLKPRSTIERFILTQLFVSYL